MGASDWDVPVNRRAEVPGIIRVEFSSAGYGSGGLARHVFVNGCHVWVSRVDFVEIQLARLALYLYTLLAFFGSVDFRISRVS